MIDEGLRAWLIDKLGEQWADAIQQNLNNQVMTTPRIFYQRSGTTQDLLLNVKSPIITTNFDLEVISDSIQESADIAEMIKDEILGYSGDMGTTQVLLAEYEDHDDNYIPQGLGDGDEGKHIATLRLSIIHN